MRFLGAVVATVLASSLGTLVACSAQDKEENVPTAQAVSGASVQIAILDANGNRVGDASGTLIAPRLVLTAGHAISGQYKWQVTSADGKQKVLGTRGMTYDWMTYDSMKAHPRRHDVGVIHLDEAIKLPAYPKLVGDKAIDGLSATRMRNTGAKFEQLPVNLKKVPSSPNNWVAEMSGGETLDTGGAVYDERGIVGIVSGRGLTTGKLYVARVDQLNGWLADKVACGTPTSTRTYAAPSQDKSAAECDDAGNPLSSSGHPSSSGTPGTSGPNGGGSDGSCSGNDDGVCSGAGCGEGGSNPNQSPGDDDDDNGPGGSGPSSSSGGGSNPGAGSSGANGANPNGDDDDDNGGPNPNQPGSSSGQSSGETGSNHGGNAGSSGNNGNVSSSSSGGNGGSGSGKGHGGAGGHSAHDDGESCQGANDNPEVCPPEPEGCRGASCGGGNPDDLVDYGNCACKTGKGDDDLHVH